MPDFQVFQPVAAMEYPFSNVAYILGKTYIFQVIAFEKSTVIQDFQGIRKLQGSKIAEIESLFTDPFQIFRKRYGFQGAAPVEGTVINIGYTVR